MLEGVIAFVLPRQEPVSQSKEGTRSLCASCCAGIALINNLKPALLRDADIWYASCYPAPCHELLQGRVFALSLTNDDFRIGLRKELFKMARWPEVRANGI